MDFGLARKRGRPGAGLNGNAGFKKSKQGILFLIILLDRGIIVILVLTFDTIFSILFIVLMCSTSGCPFGEGCHFLHHVPGGLKAVNQMSGGNHQSLPPTARPSPLPPSFPDGSSPPAVKSRLCNKFNSAEGCRFGDKCHFAHGEWELGKPTVQSSGRFGGGGGGGGGGGRMDLNPAANNTAAASFGASATAKISVNASLAGGIIGKNGVNSKQIIRSTGAKLSIRDHESDPNLRNIELEGTFDQIKQASQMVRELIVNISSASSGPPPPHKSFGRPGGGGGGGGGFGGGPAGNFKTKLCENFTKGSCTFGERCHFAHGAEELRSSGA